MALWRSVVLASLDCLFMNFWNDTRIASEPIRSDIEEEI
ncbi:unnamed protein product [Acidithrix sp. C25]|nr:unnamed protein product [Acidithrix sp. C25]